MKNLFIPLLISLLVFSCNQSSVKNPEATFENQVNDYIQKFPYQDTYNYMNQYTGGESSKLNSWVLGSEPVLVKAGDDKVVRMNNDTYYNMAFMDLSQGPVKLSFSNSSEDRFYSFQLMDDRNTNFRNVIGPSGDYYLYFGDNPGSVEGELIETPSELTVVIVRVELKDQDNEEDVKQAKEIFRGISIEGPEIKEFPSLDLLSSFDEEVTKEANRLIDSTMQNTPFRLMIAATGQVPNEVSYLQLAAGTKGGWGGPVTSHSAYESLMFDKNGEVLNGSKGTYRLTTTEPPVDAFWSITVYDTEKGGFLHPNNQNKYHINNTGAVKNEDGTVTFLFKQKCEEGDINCLEVPAGTFDLTTRYYLPHEEIRSGEWTFPKPELIKD